MKKLLILAALAGGILRFYSPHVEGYYSAYRAHNGRVIHMIMSDNGTPDDFFDDWLVDWEYR